MQMMIRTIRRNQSTGITPPVGATAARSTRFLFRTAAVFMVAAASAVGLQAQQAATSHPYLDLTSPTAASDNTSSSSSVSSELLADESLSTTQPPPRRTYGRPRYSDKSHNPDGSSRYTFAFGGGLTLPTGITSNDLTTGYKFQAGGGRNFNNKFATLIQFDWDNFGFQTATLNKQLAIYNAEIAAFNTANPGTNATPIARLGGTSHLWSFTVNPVYTFAQSDKLGAYVVGAAGFYHKTADFTVPTVATSCSFYYGCFQYQANQSVDKYTSNAPGFNGGFGITYKGSRFSSVKIFAEARYVYVFNEARRFSEGSSGSNYYNVFPQNSYRTSYVPITFGLRF